VSDSSQFSLLGQRRFAPFFWTQFCGAANDNVFKYSFTLLVTFEAAAFSSFDPAMAVNLIAAAFILPFVLLSATSGQLADRSDLAHLMRAVKVLEVAVMALAAIGFYLHSFVLLFTCTLLMGVHSTLFGPAKYAYLPRHLDAGEIVGGNGMVEMGTFVAILIGTMLGGILIASGPNGHLAAATMCIAIAFIGLGCSAAIPSTPAADRALRIDWNPLRETIRNLGLARERRVVFLALLGISWLWFFGAIFLTQFAPFAKSVLGGGPGVANLLLATFTIGIAIGSLLCDRLSRRVLDVGLVPFGSIGMSLFTIDLWWACSGLPLAEDQSVGEFLGHAAHWRLLADLFLVSVCAGLYSVPLYALIQTRCAPAHRARIVAANNIVNALFMIVSSLLAIVVLSVMKWTIPQLFLLTALLNALVAAYIYTRGPEFLLRFLSWLIVNLVYRVRRRDTERIPASGAAVIVSNHVSYVDALVIMAASPRPIRFVMDATIFRFPVLSWLFRQARAIAVVPAREDPEQLARAMSEVSQALRDGELVCIFPEGKLTTDGDLDRFRSGITRVLAADPVPVVPLALQGLWGSFFSRKGAPPMSRPLRRGAWSRIGISVGIPVAAAEAAPDRLRELVGGLRGEWK
jgi:hypothetical protein